MWHCPRASSPSQARTSGTNCDAPQGTQRHCPLRGAGSPRSGAGTPSSRLSRRVQCASASCYAFPSTGAPWLFSSGAACADDAARGRDLLRPARWRRPPPRGQARCCLPGPISTMHDREAAGILAFRTAIVLPTNGTRRIPFGRHPRRCYQSLRQKRRPRSPPAMWACLFWRRQFHFDELLILPFFRPRWIQEARKCASQNLGWKRQELF